MIIELGERLKALRTENHLRQDQVARLVNVEKSSISMYETGVRQPSYITLVRLADVFNVSTDYLLGRKNNSPLDLSGLTAAVALNWIEDRADFTPDAVISRGELVQLVNNVLELYRA